MPLSTAQARIHQLQAEVEFLKQTAVLDLRERRVAIAQELHEVEAALRRLTGKPPEKNGRRRRRNSG